MSGINNPSASASTDVSLVAQGLQSIYYEAVPSGASVVSSPTAWSTTTIGTASNPGFDPTTLAGSLQRRRFTSPAAINQTCGYTGPSVSAQSPVPYRRISGDPLGGGFRYATMFGLATVRDNQAFFFGVNSTTTDATINGIVTTNYATYLMLGKDQGDATLQWLSRNASGVVNSVDTGLTLTSLQGAVLSLEILCARGADSVDFTLRNHDTGDVYTETLDAQLPAADVKMYPFSQMATGNLAATAIAVDFYYMGMENYMKVAV